MIKWEPERVILLEQAVFEYLDELQKIQKESPNTIRSKKNTLIPLIEYLKRFKVKYPYQISLNHLKAFIKYQFGKLQASSLSIKIYHLRSFFDYLIVQGLVLDNYANKLPLPKVPKIESDYLTETELIELIDAVKQYSRPKSLTKNLLVISLLIFPCLRVSELVSIENANIDLEGKKIRIKRKGAREQFLPIDEDRAKLISIWWDELEEKGLKSPWLFPNKKNPSKHNTTRQIRALVRQFLEKAHLVKRNMGPHLLRHSGASLLLKKGIDLRTVQHILGHEHISTTEKYLHTDYQIVNETLNGTLKIIG